MSTFTCFLYAHELNNEGGLCLRLNQQGGIDAPLERRSFSDIQALQHNATTVVIVSAGQLSFYRVELPWLPEKKARAALPYALEDTLAEPVDELHFAFDRAHYQNGHYLVAVCDKVWLGKILSQLKQYEIDFDTITADWFALKEKELVALDNGYLIYDKGFFSGFLPPELAPLYLEKLPDDINCYLFDNREHPELGGQVQRIDLPDKVWIAQRLQSNKYINLSQGDFELRGSHANTRRWYWAAAAVGLLWLISFLLINGWQIHTLNAQIQDVDKNIAQVYRQFFPEAKQIISPRFRIGQLLKSRKQTGDSALWLLLNQLTLAIQEGNTSIEQLKFQNQTMQVTVLSRDFDTLEAMQTFLQKTRINVKQLQAASHDKQVMATLELSL